MNIVLCATQRCGSTLVVEDMRNTGVLGQPKEWFVPWRPDKSEIDWKSKLAAVKTRATGENGVSAIKVMANQLLPVEECLATFQKVDVEGVFPRVAGIFSDAKWIWLRREDVVAQAISRMMAEQTGINHATAKADDPHFAGNLAKGYDADYNAKTVYRYGAILRRVTAITLENLAWRRFFDDHAITPLELVYEEVIADPEMRHLDTMAQLVGLEDTPPRRPRSMVKMGNEKNARWRERFFEDAGKNRYMPPKSVSKPG